MSNEREYLNDWLDTIETIEYEFEQETKVNLEIVIKQATSVLKKLDQEYDEALVEAQRSVRAALTNYIYGDTIKTLENLLKSNVVERDSEVDRELRELVKKLKHESWIANGPENA